MPRHDPVEQWTRAVATHLPHLSPAHAAVLALWSLGMVLARSCALTAVTHVLATWQRRTANTVWHEEDRLEIHPHDAETRGVNDGDWVGVASRAGETVLHAVVTERVQPGVVYTTFHFPESGANVITTENSDWATNCPEYKVTAVEVTRVSQPSEWQRRFQEFSARQQELLDAADAATTAPRT